MIFNWRYLLFVPIALFVTIYLGKAITLSPFFIVAIVASIIVGMVTFQKPENGLLIIVFSMMLSPEIILAKLPGRAITVRIDDLLIVVIFVAWLAHISVDKDWKGFVKTPLDGPLLVLLVLYILSTVFGIIKGNLNPVKSFFYSLKYIEYFILYWMTTNIVSNLRSIPRYLLAGFITCVIVTLFAYSVMATAPRVYAPFDTGGAGAEPASLGGYYLVIYSLLIAFLLHAESRYAVLALLGAIFFIFPVFIKTLSRASYLAFIPMVLTMILFTKRRKLLFVVGTLTGLLLFPIFFNDLYNSMHDRVMVTFTGYQSPSMTTDDIAGGAKIKDQSALERIESWKFVINQRLARDFSTVFIGNGVTGVGFVEGQFFLMLGELGLIGVAVFYWAMIKILLYSYDIYKNADNTLPQSLSLALMGCVVALTFQSFTTNTFIIVRIMEPFWFLTALVLGVVYSSKEFENTDSDKINTFKTA